MNGKTSLTRVLSDTLNVPGHTLLFHPRQQIVIILKFCNCRLVTSFIPWKDSYSGYTYGPVSVLPSSLTTLVRRLLVPPSLKVGVVGLP